MDSLSAREVAILDFERECALLSGPKEPSIRQRFAVSPTTYYRALERADRPPRRRTSTTR